LADIAMLVLGDDRSVCMSSQDVFHGLMLQAPDDFDEVLTRKRRFERGKHDVRCVDGDDP
jgi:hypothetical protein